MSVYSVSKDAKGQITSAVVHGRHWRTNMIVELLGHAYVVAGISPQGHLALDSANGHAVTLKATIANDLIKSGNGKVVVAK